MILMEEETYMKKCFGFSHIQNIRCKIPVHVIRVGFDNILLRQLRVVACMIGWVKTVRKKVQ